MPKAIVEAVVSEKALLMRRSACEASKATRYVVVSDGKGVVHALRVEPGQVVHSGLPNLELFATEKEALKAHPRVKFSEERDDGRIHSNLRRTQ